MKIASWNVNSIKVRLPHVLEWLQNNDADVLSLQEIKTTDDQFPLAALEEIGYRCAVSGQKTYNGVAILSKHDTSDIQTDIAGLDDPQRRILAATINDVRIINLYVPNGSSVDSDKYAYKLDWLEHVTNFLKQQLQQYPKLLVMGDFNIAPEDRDVHDPDAWRGQVLFSEPEHTALQKIFGLGLTDTFRQFEQEPDSFSWWDYRQAAFRRGLGLRIDLLLASAEMAQVCQSASIDVGPRRLERPSDHAPVCANFNL